MSKRKDDFKKKTQPNAKKQRRNYPNDIGRPDRPETGWNNDKL